MGTFVLSALVEDSQETARRRTILTYQHRLPLTMRCDVQIQESRHFPGLTLRTSKAEGKLILFYRVQTKYRAVLRNASGTIGDVNSDGRANRQQARCNAPDGTSGDRCGIGCGLQRVVAMPGRTVVANERSLSSQFHIADDSQHGLRARCSRRKPRVRGQAGG